MQCSVVSACHDEPAASDLGLYETQMICKVLLAWHVQNGRETHNVVANWQLLDYSPCWPIFAVGWNQRSPDWPSRRNHVFPALLRFAATRHAPESFIGNRGTPFLSHVTAIILSPVNHIAYHLQTNGLPEGLSRAIAKIISTRVLAGHTSRDDIRLFVTHGYNTARQSTTEFPLFFLLYGRCLSTFEVLVPDSRNMNVDTFSIPAVSRAECAWHVRCAEHCLARVISVIATANTITMHVFHPVVSCFSGPLSTEWAMLRSCCQVLHAVYSCLQDFRAHGQIEDVFLHPSTWSQPLVATHFLRTKLFQEMPWGHDSCQSERNCCI